MTQADNIQTILKDSNYHLSLFSEDEIEFLHDKVFFKNIRDKETPCVTCIVRDKDIQLKPEEIVRQLYAERLIRNYRYPKKRLAFEYPVNFGREKKSADIVILDKNRPDTSYIIVELKKPKLRDGKNQLRSYCNATGAPIGVWTNGEQISYYHRKDPNYFENITDIPKAGQSLQEILSERFTLKDLIIKDKIANERKSPKDIILEMEDEVLANAGIDVFEEVFKLIFTKRDEYMIDTASGSCGFPVHTIFKFSGRLFTNEEISEEDKQHVLKVFGIDFDEKTVRVARTLNLIAGDGETNVLHLNTLDFDRWSDKTEKDRKWINTYGRGFERLEKLRRDKDENKQFKFDVLMANPPFAGDIKESRILHQYELGFKKGKAQNKVGRDILFIERNPDFLKPGGRMAIVLPQGRFNNTSDQYIREFIAERARLLAVVGLHGNTFKPHTGTKTSVLFVLKWDEELCPKVEDYPVFFAVSEKGGKNNSGDYVYLKNENGQDKLDKNGHLIVDHDLHNHDGELPDGIAEAFIAWAKNEQLSFWR